MKPMRAILALPAALLLGAAAFGIWKYSPKHDVGEVDYTGAATACIVAQSEVKKRFPAGLFPSCHDNPWQVQTFANLSWLVKSSVELPDGPHKFEVSVRRDTTSSNLTWQAIILTLD